MTSNDNDGKMSSRSCDVLIIDGGSAGLRATIEAHDAGSQVLIVSKSRRGDPHTALARGSINAALGTMDPQDNWMIHAADTLSEGLPFPFLLREVFYLLYSCLEMRCILSIRKIIIETSYQHH